MSYKFFNSNQVKIFPSYNRSTVTDPEARLSTEYNFTHLPGLRLGQEDTYVISESNNKLCCVIHGYYFEIADDLKLSDTTDTIAEKLVICVKTQDIALGSPNKSTTILVPMTVANDIITPAGHGTLDVLDSTKDDPKEKCLAIVAVDTKVAIPNNNAEYTFYPLDLTDDYLKPVLTDEGHTSLQVIEDIRKLATSGVTDEQKAREAADNRLYGGTGIPSSPAEGEDDPIITITGLGRRLDVVQGDEATEGSIAYAVAEAVDDAKDYTDELIGVKAEGDTPASGICAEIAAAADAVKTYIDGDFKTAIYGEFQDDRARIDDLETAVSFNTDSIATNTAGIIDLRTDLDRLVGKGEEGGDDVPESLPKETAERKAADALINEKFGDNYSKDATVASAIAEAKAAGTGAATALDAYKTEMTGALAAKADKSVVDAMYTNGKIDELIQGVKDYADANDADAKYGIAYDSDAKKITLVEGGTNFEIDATDFVKDGMISNVTIGNDNDLVITFNTDAGKENIVLPLDQLVDIYTGAEGTRVTVSVSSDKKVSADLVAGSITKNYLDSAVQTSLGKADTALQADDLTDYAKIVDVTASINTAVTTVNKNLQDNYLSKTEIEDNLCGIYAIAFDLSTYSGNLEDDFKEATSRPMIFISKCSKLPSPPDDYAWFDRPNEGTQVIEEDIAENIILYLKAIQEAPETTE